MYSRKTRHVFFTALALAMSASLFSCNDTNVPTPTNPSNPGSPGTNPQVVTVHIPQGAMNMDGDAFGQNPLNVDVGTTVTWINDDSVQHTTTSDTGVWDSGPLSMGQSFSWTFSEAGDFPYHCTIHPNMTGTVHVGPSPSPSPSPEPSASPSPWFD